MAEMEEQELADRMSWEEVTEADRRGLLEHSREFLDLFWDIAKMEQQTRLEATEKLLEYLRARPEGSEMKYALKRLITGLGMMREHARPCYSLALAQLLQSFEDIPLLSILQQIQEKYKLDSLTKATMRSSLFGNLFGVLALFQSGRLVKDLEALLECVKLLQALAQHHNHLQEQPRRALVDILSEVPDNLWQGLLPRVLSTDLDVILSSPEHLELFLLARKKAPAKLQKAMGSVNLFSDENLPRLVEVLRRAAASVKKEQKLPPVALGMLRLALEEDKFPQFWKQVVEQGLLQKQLWPVNYMCFYLLGTALPLLSKEQLQLVLRGDLARLLGEHMVTSQVQNKFKFLPELTKLVVTFLEGSRDDPEKQLAVLVDLTSITNQGLPAIPTFWHVTRFLSPRALQGYVAWLQEMFIQPKLDSLVDFSTGVQKKARKAAPSMPGRAVFRLRKWIIHRLVSMIDHMVQEKDEAMINQLARFCLFHSFFKTKKPVAQIPETKHQFSVPLEARDREIISDGFFSLLQALSSPVREAAAQALGGQLWTHRLLQLANTLLNQNRNVTPVTPFTTQQREAWDQMLQTLKELEARSSEAKATAFHHLLLLVGINLFKSPAESCDLLGDIQACIKKSMEETAQQPRAKATNSEEPPWVEVMVEILLTLLSKPSHLMRRVARNVFGHICSHLTHRALELILVVVNPESSQDAEDNVVVTDDAAEEQDKDKDDENKNSDSEGEEEEDEESEEERDKDVDPGFREQLMEVLRAGKALGEGDSEDDGEELDDEAMMALDKNLASLFAEQKLRIQARQDEKMKLQKEKALRWDFQIRVLDLIEVLVSKHPKNALILELIEPLLSIIRRSSGGSKQERDLLHKTARILTENLFRTRQCCQGVGARADAVHAQLEQLVQQASRQTDSSIAFYYFNASLYLLRVLKMNPAPKSVPKKRQKKQKAVPESSSKDPQITSCLDLMRVTSAYSAALSSFLTKRNSPLTIPMFLCLFSRHPMICKNLVPIMVQHIAGPTRPHNQVQACQLLQKSLCISELKVCFEDAEWEQLISGVMAQAAKNLQALGTPQTKPEHQREASSLELLNSILRTISNKKLTVDLTGLLGVLQSQQQKMTENLQQGEHANTSSRLQDLYWQAMKYLGAQRPKLEKEDTKKVPSIPQSPISMKQKKKGFLPETKKRKKRKAEDMAQEAPSPAATAADLPPSTGKKRKKMKAKLPAQAQVNGTPPAKSPVPSDSPAKTPKQQKQQTPKAAQVSEAIPTSLAEPVAEKPHLKPLPKKRVLGKSPLSPLPRKKARLSLATRGPLLFQFGAKKKKVKA